jgi:cytochrome b6-f complex iron-sulfur subunit
MQRRRLLNWLRWTGLGAIFPALLGTGCQPNSGEDNQGFAYFVDLPVLDEEGFILQDYFAKVPVLAVRDPQDKNVVRAVNALCSHEQCLVNWKKEKGVFVCPCHGSTFGPDGKFLQGPADGKPLQTFPTKIEGQELWVKA